MMIRSIRQLSGVLALCMIASLSQAELLAYYTFNDGTARDVSGNGRHGTLSAIAPEYVANYGVTGGSFRFRGFESGQFNHIDLPVDVRTSTTPIVTMGLWVRVQANWATSTTNLIGQILSSDDGGFDRTITNDPRAGTTASGWKWQVGAFAGNQAVVGTGFSGYVDPMMMVVLRHNQLTGEFSLTSGRLGVMSHVNRTGVLYNGSSRNFLRLGDSASNNIWDERFHGWADNVFVYNEWVSDARLAEIYGNNGADIVPEPATIAALGLGALLVARRRRAR